MARRRRRQPRLPQFPDELRRIDHIGQIAGKRGCEQHAIIGDAGKQAEQIERVQHDDEHREHIFPEEAFVEQILAKDDLFPDRTGDHDCVER
jgi:hypothetical protein